jgi:hypothetical protein
VFLWVFLSMVALLRIEWWPLTGIPMYSFYRDHTYSYRHLRDAAQAQQVALEHAASGYPNALAWSNLWITLRLCNMDPKLRQQKDEKKQLKQQSSAAAGPERKSVESSGLLSSEREFVNLKARVTDKAYTRGGRKGVYLKQWRRTLHNVASADMASKPLGQIEVQPLDSPNAPTEVYPALAWLRLQLPHLRQWAHVNNWALPDWVDQYGELQLRVKLRDRYAILARIPWRGDGTTPRELRQSDAALEAIRASGVNTSTTPREQCDSDENGGEESPTLVDYPETTPSPTAAAAATEADGDSTSLGSRSRSSGASGVRKAAAGRSVDPTAEPASPRSSSPAGRRRSPRSAGAAGSSKKKKNK